MTIGQYTDPLLGGAGGATNIIEGIEMGDPKQVAGGAYQGLGAYTAANSMLTQQAFEAGYATALEMGLEGTAATQYANQAAQGAGLTGASAIGEWLPWIGAGLAAYNIATGNIKGGAQGLAAASFMSMPWTGPYGFAAGVFYSLPSLLGRKRTYDEHIYFHESDLELIYKDDEGNYYLYDNSEETGRKPTGSTLTGDSTTVLRMDSRNRTGYGSGSLIKFNPDTNEITRGNIGTRAGGREVGRLTAEETKEILQNGYLTNENGNKYYFIDEATKQASGQGGDHTQFVSWQEGDFDPQIEKGSGGRGSQTYYNIQVLQSQIYNEVLLPEGLAPETGWQPIMIGGQEYRVDSSGAVADSEGRLVGTADMETGQVNTFKMDYRIDYGEENPKVFSFGTIDNWDQVSQTFDQPPITTEDIEPSLDEQIPTPQPQGLPGFTPQPMQEEQPQQGLPGFMPTINQPDQLQVQEDQPQPQGLPGFQDSFDTQSNNIPMPSQGLPGFQNPLPSDGLAAGI